MAKNELIAAVADKAQMTKTAAASAVDATFDAITGALKKGGEVKIMGFGNFRVVKRAAREGRDPRTGAPVKITAAPPDDHPIARLFVEERRDIKWTGSLGVVDLY